MKDGPFYTILINRSFYFSSYYFSVFVTYLNFHKSKFYATTIGDEGISDSQMRVNHLAAIYKVI